ncbi:hypothetical protein ABG768_010535 [Culter alburnus]|uniref:Uncharacterized protein n=1 Tax=Culter alburnus TaxID=194366 RepID=A0AAW1ZBY3_CULAL
MNDRKLSAGRSSRCCRTIFPLQTSDPISGTLDEYLAIKVIHIDPPCSFSLPPSHRRTSQMLKEKQFQPSTVNWPHRSSAASFWMGKLHAAMILLSCID